MKNYRKPNLAWKIVMLCLTIVSIFVLSDDMFNKGAFHTLWTVLYIVLAICLLVAIIRHKESLRRYTQYRIRRANQDTITDELVKLLDSIALDEPSRGPWRFRYYVSRTTNSHLGILKTKRSYLCLIIKDEFGSYDVGTSTETRIEESWTYRIPRRAPYDVARQMYEKTNKVFVDGSAVPTNSIPNFIQGVFGRGGRMKEATASDLHHLYQNIRHATAV